MGAEPEPPLKLVRAWPDGDQPIGRQVFGWVPWEWPNGCDDNEDAARFTLPVGDPFGEELWSNGGQFGSIYLIVHSTDMIEWLIEKSETKIVNSHKVRTFYVRSRRWVAQQSNVNDKLLCELWLEAERVWQATCLPFWYPGSTSP